MENKRAILLLSGGIDSTTLLAKLSNEGYEIVAVSFQYGQKHEVELNYAKRNVQKYEVCQHHIIKLDKVLFNSSALINEEIAVSRYEDKKIPKGKVNVYVPFRNLLFLSTTLSLAETMQIHQVFIAVNKDDATNFWDCKADFIKKINAIAHLNKSIQVKTPFINLSKSAVVKLSHQLGVDLKQTISCYQPNGEDECGKCLSCITKLSAIESARSLK